METRSETIPQINPLIYSQRPQNRMFPLICLLLVGILSYSSIRFTIPLMEARRFAAVLPQMGVKYGDFSGKGQPIPEGDVPYRTGKLMVVVPEYTIVTKSGTIVTIHPEIHPVWYRLKKSMRATSPEEADTLIRIEKVLRKARRFREAGSINQRIVSFHAIHIKVYNWKTKSYIGQWVIDPGEPGIDTLSSREIEKIINMTSNDTILNMIESMPLRNGV